MFGVGFSLHVPTFPPIAMLGEVVRNFFFFLRRADTGTKCPGEWIYQAGLNIAMGGKGEPNLKIKK